jgi:hypothetical protein
MRMGPEGEPVLGKFCAMRAGLPWKSADGWEAVGGLLIFAFCSFIVCVAKIKRNLGEDAWLALLNADYWLLTTS